MAGMTFTLTAEMEEMHDAITLLQQIHGCLAKKHGDAFRRLDRTIEGFIENPADCVDVHYLGEGKVLAAPKGALVDIFREARRLGVIV